MILHARKIWQKHLQTLRNKRHREMALRTGMLCMWNLNTYIYRIEKLLKKITQT